MLKASEVAAEFFAHVLWNTTDGAMARDYLKSREISVETARAFMIGYAPSRPASLAQGTRKARTARGGPQSRAGRRRDGDRTRYDMFRARVMFPIRDAQGRAIAFGGRVLDARLPKYINSPESPLYSKTRTLYGLFEARQAISSSASSGKGSRDSGRRILRRDRAVAGRLQGSGRRMRHGADGRAASGAEPLHEKCDRMLRRRRGGAQSVDAGAGDFPAGGTARPRDLHSVGLRSRHVRSRARRGRVRGADRQGASCWSIIF